MNIYIFIWIHHRSERQSPRCRKSAANQSGYCGGVWQTSHYTDNCWWRVLAFASTWNLSHQCKWFAKYVVWFISLRTLFLCNFV